MVNPLSDERVDELREWCENGKADAMAWGVSREEVLALCATASYWRRKHEHLEAVTTGELAAIDAAA